MSQQNKYATQLNMLFSIRKVLMDAPFAFSVAGTMAFKFLLTFCGKNYNLAAVMEK